MMKLYLSSPRGFCAGVIRAIQTVELALVKWGAPIYVKHQIVHNRYVVDGLEQKGAIFVEDLTAVPRGSYLIYSAHGVSPEVRAIAKERELKEIDATCGLVTRVHSAAKRFAAKNYHIILIGHRNHVEVQGTAGEVLGNVTIIESVAEVDKLTFSPEQKLFYLTQTTLSLIDVEEIVFALRQKYPSVDTLPSSSICYATTNRQLALQQIVEKSQIIIVVGDKLSSNSNRLRELGEKAGVPSYLINSPGEINPEWLLNVESIGLTAGASTPESIVQNCIARLEELGVKETEEISFATENVLFQLPKEVTV
ncbi:MAG: 4-hydroxy-3-methylbut-2-enyl diphosphate reductase [Chlamydiales bacterium]